MCNFFSAIITRNEVLWHKDLDSHEEILKYWKVKRDTYKRILHDSNYTPSFVRIEIIPQDNDIFNHNLKNWRIKIDQDIIPEWFERNRLRYEDQAYEALKCCWKKTFITNRRVKLLKKGRWFVGENGVVEELAKDGKISKLGRNGRVRRVKGLVEIICNNGVVETIVEEGKVNKT